jgi:CO dehydrogenase nickel-insertion accessory protein CooC1
VEAELPGTVVIADMEAGLEHLSWAGGTLRYVDTLLIVAEPQSKVLLTAGRAHRLATQLGVERIAFVGNRARPGEEQRLEEFAASLGSELVAVVPEDPAVTAADRDGVCPLDSAPESPAVSAIRRLAADLEARYLAAAPDR